MIPSDIMRYNLKFNVINMPNFEAIRVGRKTVETRAATKKYQNIKAGDILVLTCGNKKLLKTVKRARVFKTISALFKKYKVGSVNPWLKTIKEAEEMFYSYPGYKEKIEKYGLIAMELK